MKVCCTEKEKEKEKAEMEGTAIEFEIMLCLRTLVAENHEQLTHPREASKRRICKKG